MFLRNRRKLLQRNKRTGSQEKAKEIQFKDPREIQIMREAGRIVARVHAAFRDAIRPGISTWELDQIALEVMRKYDATSSFLGYKGFPAHICTSINDELVHGIPHKKRVLKSGDIISIDVGVKYRGFIGDSAWSYAVGPISEFAALLMATTERSLFAGIEKAHIGNRVIDISRAVQQCVESQGMHVVRQYTGHGVGREMHEAPQVLNYVSDDADGRVLLQPGLVVAIEPMVQMGTVDTKTLRDKWTVVSKDHSLAAHFEHTVAITARGPEILTLP